VSRDGLAGVSNDEDERSELGGEEAIPGRVSLLLLPVCVVVMLLLDGVRIGFVLFAESTLDADLRETMAESDEVCLPKGRFFGTSDNPASASAGSLGLLFFGVCGGGAVLCRGICSRVGESRSWLSRSASELRALEAALIDIGDGRE
jgi:hypothetical protein